MLTEIYINIIWSIEQILYDTYVNFDAKKLKWKF